MRRSSGTRNRSSRGSSSRSNEPPLIRAAHRAGMTPLEHHTGDLLTTTAPAIAHGVNTVGVMGAGIAVQFARRHSVMKDAYAPACQNDALNPGDVFAWKVAGANSKHDVIYILASQDLPGLHSRLGWLESSLDYAVSHAETAGIDRIALPRSGRGIGGLDQDEAEQVMARVAATSSTVTLEVWTLA
ncbi:hypothetical protein C5C45_00465 [Rathayibacter rathayi]|uniref:Macro domain-containing protein n=2 Tax=Rathayibacter rathayi TaxID=33887 RepID=A0ABX5AEU7_RATRA|nr:hypothetical protein C5C34_05950 [Rathayibacter rathayi]PPF51594.1 hypothetical protein C5C08_01940 [Rathayibacter rathayi]PPF83185.1 hypothetical protein C5C14_01980 [Rathayibacter rathayi]PPG47015.1 hypothetical protein C5C20_01935 [Rathayibacter rathayi]PPG96524.1 hypothetical protein C5C22_02590 [Rathayibacter rathayi]